MYRFVFLCLSAASVACGSSDAVQQTLPAINVQYDFPASETLLSKREVLDASGREEAFQQRLRSLQEGVDRMGEVAGQFMHQAMVDLDRLSEVVRLSLP